MTDKDDDPRDDQHDDHDDRGDDRGPDEQKTNTMAIVSLVCGVVGVLTCCCVLFSPLSIASIITGAVSLSQFKANPNQKGKVMAQIGIALSAVTLLLFLVLLILQLTGVITPPDFKQFQPR